EKLTWRPHDRSRSLGALAQHLAHLPDWGSLILDHRDVDLANVPATPADPESRSAILKLFDETRARTRKALDKTDADLGGMWSLKREGQEIFSLPKAAAFRSFVL